MTGEPNPLDRIRIVLWQPQDLVNIAATIRVMKNFGLGHLRLVQPAEWDEWRIEGIAHDTADLVERTEIFETLEDAIGDCEFVAAMTARERRAKRVVGRPRDSAADILARAARPDGAPIAILFGREDRGLTNTELDRCHLAITIPTDPGYTSLNLAQAVLVIAYELWMASEGSDQEFKPPRRDAPPANVHLLERTFEDAERALWAIDFFKSRQTESVMRSLRELFRRADPDERETGLIRAISIEVVKYINRISDD